MTGPTWAQTTFGPEQVIIETPAYLRSIHPADLDGDGDLDVLSGLDGDYNIAWYENLDGTGDFGPPRVITTAADYTRSVYAADLDGDGDLDVLSASHDDDKIAWYENTDGTGGFGPQQVIAAEVWRASSVYAADLDGDGDIDVLSASAGDKKIAWYENTDGAGDFGPRKVITVDATRALSVHAADLDGDGDIDVLSASEGDDKIAWYENTDGAGGFGPQQVITTAADEAQSVYAADLDGDGDFDVLSASYRDDKIAWYENTDGAGGFGPQRVIVTTGGRGAMSVYAADLDGDGDIDVLSSSWNINKISWYENLDGAGSFGPPQILNPVASFLLSARAADLDGDGDIDVLSASYSDDKIAWYENIDGVGEFGPEQAITPATASGAFSVFAADLDGDGDTDVLSASHLDAKIAWYENTDGVGGFGPQQVITTDAWGANTVYATDLDGDGDVDVLSASFGDDKIAWYENTDGVGGFGPRQVIAAGVRRAVSVHATDLDGDGDADVLSASDKDDEIAWYENTDGAGSFGPPQVITTAADGASAVHAADLDGDADVLSASEWDDKIAWYENTDGAGGFGPQQVITTEAFNAQAVYAADLDGDGDTDVLAGALEPSYDPIGKSAWYVNEDGAGRFGPQQLLTERGISAYSVHAADLDGDADIDLLSAAGDYINWYENMDGTGRLGPRQPLTWKLKGAWSVYAADLDGDGDKDVLSASHGDSKIAWFENLHITVPIELSEFIVE